MTKLTLTGTLTAANIVTTDDGSDINIKVDLGQNIPSGFRFYVTNRNPAIERSGQAMLSALARATANWKFNDASQLVGKRISVEVVQPAVTPGLIAPLVNVGLGVGL